MGTEALRSMWNIVLERAKTEIFSIGQASYNNGDLNKHPTTSI